MEKKPSNPHVPPDVQGEKGKSDQSTNQEHEKKAPGASDARVENSKTVQSNAGKSQG